MPVRGIKRVKRNYRVVVDKIAGQTTERTVHEILKTGGGKAKTMTPMDTSNLLNSQYAPEISVHAGRVTGHLGYTAEYAADVHAASGTFVGKGVLRDPNDPSRGDFWDPNAEPGFLDKGFEDAKPEIPAILKRNYGV